MIAMMGLLKDNPNPTDEEIRIGLEGVICRCTGYQFIVSAVKHAAKLMAEEKSVSRGGAFVMTQKVGARLKRKEDPKATNWKWLFR